MSPHTKEMRRNFWMLLIAFSLLIIIGTSNVFSSTFVEDMAEGGSAYGHLIRQGVYLALGLAPAIFVYKKDYHMWKKWSVRLLIATAVLLIAVLFAGIVVNGARRWLGAGGFTFQPSEIAKLAIILFTADKLAPLWDKKGHIEFFSPLSAFFPAKSGKPPRWKRIRFVPHPLLLPPLALAILVFRQPDAGTALVILFLPLVMFWVSGASILKARVPLLGTLAVGIVYLLSAPYRMNRIISWYDPWSYEKTLGYQTVQGLIAIGSGGVMGQGLGEGISKFSYLPEAQLCFCRPGPGMGPAGVRVYAGFVQYDYLFRLQLRLEYARYLRETAGRGHYHVFWRSGDDQSGHGQRNPARRRRAAAFYQLWRYVPSAQHGRRGAAPQYCPPQLPRGRDRCPPAGAAGPAFDERGDAQPFPLTMI